jgi:hypothetical protein
MPLSKMSRLPAGRQYQGFDWLRGTGIRRVLSRAFVRSSRRFELVGLLARAGWTAPALSEPLRLGAAPGLYRDVPEFGPAQMNASAGF